MDDGLREKIKLFRINKKGLSIISIIEQFSDFLGDYRAFFREKWRIKVEHSEWETKITKLPWQRSVRPQCQDGVEVLKCYELRCQDIKRRYTKPEHTK